MCTEVVAFQVGRWDKDLPSSTQTIRARDSFLLPVMHLPGPLKRVATMADIQEVLTRIESELGTVRGDRKRELKRLKRTFEMIARLSSKETAELRSMAVGRLIKDAEVMSRTELIDWLVEHEMKVLSQMNWFTRTMGFLYGLQ